MQDGKTEVGLVEHPANVQNVPRKNTEVREPSTDNWALSDGSRGRTVDDSGTKNDNDVIRVADDVIHVDDDVINMADDVISVKDE